MPHFAANLSMLFTELPLAERFAAAAAAGFDTVEIQFPYELAIEQLQAALQSSGLQLHLINLPAGNWAGGERGIACHPDRIAEFRQGVASALAYARALDAAQINCLAGILPEGVSPAQAEAVLLDNLRYAATELAPFGIGLQIEAINTIDVPGFFLHNSAQALALIEKAGLANLFFQYDAYHMQIMEGNLINTLHANLNRISHIQIADVPGRHEPGSGEINFPNLFKALDAMGYSGLVSLEYIPRTGTTQSLRWLCELKQSGGIET